MKMNRWPRKYAVIASVAVLGLVLMVAASYRASSAYLQSHKSAQAVPIVINKTKSITVTEISLTASGIVEVTLFNGSSWLITLYTFAIGEGQIMPLGGIPAGGTTVQKFSESSFNEAAAKDGSGIGELTILALSFGGGGGEGDPEEVAKLEETTVGMKEQIASFLPALLRAANSTAVESEDNLQSFEVETQLPSKMQNGLSPARKGGQELAKLLISKDVQTIRDQRKLDRNRTYQQGLAERLKYYQRRLTEL
jgi:hypothetical protein